MANMIFIVALMILIIIAVAVIILLEIRVKDLKARLVDRAQCNIELRNELEETNKKYEKARKMIEDAQHDGQILVAQQHGTLEKFQIYRDFPSDMILHYSEEEIVARMIRDMMSDLSQQDGFIEQFMELQKSMLPNMTTRYLITIRLGRMHDIV